MKSRQKVRLLRNFWGHKKGTKGTVINGLVLKLKGSPRARVWPPIDEGDLYEIIKEK